MAEGLKVLIVDDEPDLLEFYRELLSKLPSTPEVFTASTGARALALLESEPFSLLLTDLNMPRVDGFQILMMVRRKFPTVRTAVITGMSDPAFRTRAYAIGIDLFIEKPQTKGELQLFSECIEGLLDRVDEIGFRGVQSKSLVDLVQMECITHGSSVLKIVNDEREGRIWVSEGEVVDARVDDLRGEAAFQKILSWRTGGFEILPAEESHERVIRTSSQNLLLDYARWADEAGSEEGASGGAAEESALGSIRRIEGVEFVVAGGRNGRHVRSWGLEEPEDVCKWASELIEDAERLGETLGAGPMREIIASSLGNKMAFQSREQFTLLLGFRRDFTNEKARQVLKRVAGEWTE